MQTAHPGQERPLQVGVDWLTDALYEDRGDLETGVRLRIQARCYRAPPASVAWTRAVATRSVATPGPAS